MRYYEDLKIGERWPLGAHVFTASDIKAFAVGFDPQPFHVDEDAAARSHFGALCASGWHTASIWMRHLTEYNERENAKLQARGEAPSAFGPSPGFRELKWIRPVYAGDAISYATEILDLRPSKSRPDWGLMTLRNSGINQRGEPVISFISTAFVQRRRAAS